MSVIKIKQWPSPLQAHTGTILDIALNNGVPYPYNCRSGECGHCKTRLLSGEVVHAPCMEQALSDNERQQGYILACRAKPKTDIEIAWDRDENYDAEMTFPIRRLAATVVQLERVATDVSILRLEICSEALSFAAGQYIRLSVGGLPARSYSMANRPGENKLEFHIRHIPHGLVSNYIAHYLSIGDRIELEGPFGHSYLREKNFSGPIIAVGGGTGLAPVLSVVRTALMRMPIRPIHLYFGVRSEADIYANRQLQELTRYDQVNPHIVLSDPVTPTSRRTGFVHQALAEDFTDLADADVYVAGPPPMVDAVSDVVISKGVMRNAIYSDPFVASADVTGNSMDSSIPTSVLHKLVQRFWFAPKSGERKSRAMV